MRSSRDWWYAKVKIYGKRLTVPGWSLAVDRLEYTERITAGDILQLEVEYKMHWKGVMNSRISCSPF